MLLSYGNGGLGTQFEVKQNYQDNVVYKLAHKRRRSNSPVSAVYIPVSITLNIMLCSSYRVANRNPNRCISFSGHNKLSDSISDLYPHLKELLLDNSVLLMDAFSLQETSYRDTDLQHQSQRLASF
jgi:hypothetical protein